MSFREGVKVKIEDFNFPPVFKKALDRFQDEGLIKIQNFQKNTYVFKENECGEGLYVIKSGIVLIEKALQDSKKSRPLAILKEGAIFGEVAVLDDIQKRSASVKVLEDCAVYWIGKETFIRILYEVPGFAIWLLRLSAHRIRVADKLISQMEEMQVINKKIIEGQEQERKRIAREIHDGPAQRFADYIWKIEIAEMYLEKDIGEAKKELDILKDKLKEDMSLVRELIFDLYPKNIEEEGLENALNKFIESKRESCTFKITSNIGTNLSDCLSPEQETTVYCLVQESLNNIKKHAQADNVKLDIRIRDKSLFMVVEDDGKGFDFKNVIQNYSKGNSLGLKSMQERLDLVGGMIKVRSSEGSGTTLYVKIPLKIERGGNET